MARWPVRPTLMAWLLGLALAHGGAALLLGRAGVYRSAQMQGVRDAGALPLPSGPAAEAITQPSHWLVAAFAYSATVGVALVAIAHCVSAVTRRRPRWVRWSPAVMVGIACVLAALTVGRDLWWGWLALIFITAYTLRLRAPPATSRTPRIAAAVLGLIALAPPVLVADRDFLLDMRDGLLTSAAGSALVNTYYRHALLAAEPIKQPIQRVVAVYAVDGGSAEGPRWLQCQREPWVLLRTTRTAYADLTFTHGASGAIRLHRGSRGTVQVTPENAADVLARAAHRRDPTALRGVVMIATLAVPIGATMWLALYGLLRLRRYSAHGALAAATAAGALLAVTVVWVERVPASADLDGTALERLRAVTDERIRPGALARAARGDQVLPVRAHALAQWIHRRGVTPATLERVARAPSWYEQWHGYRALLAQGWHPASRACP